MEGGSREDWRRSGRLRLVPGVYDAFSAKAAAEAGHELLYFGSFAAQAALFAAVDARYITLTEMVEGTRRIVEAVPVPLLVDLENGFGGPLQVQRTVRAMEAAGAVGGHLEDHEFGKHTRLPTVLVPTEAMVDKILAAREARRSPDFVLIARTDALGRYGRAEAIRRLVAYEAAGADMVFMAGAGTEDLRELGRAVSVPIVNTDLYGNAAFDPAAWEAAGVRLVLAFGTALGAVLPVLRRLYALMRAGRLPDEGPAALAEVERFLGYPAYEAWAARWLWRQGGEAGPGAAG
jgi:2-methylisocitrate lyase-like PEP mutase family enzyme